MRINSVTIKNFRLLLDLTVTFDAISTVIVGRNNTGKTSLAEIFRRVFGDKLPGFALHDFSLEAHEQFWTAFTLHCNDADQDDVRLALPAIEFRLKLGYGAEEEYGGLGDFIIDLDPECREAIAVVRYALEAGKVATLFEGLASSAGNIADARPAFFKAMKDRVERLYKATLVAEDPADATNVKVLEWRRLSTLIRVDFISAQRGLDDTTSKDNDVLGRILSALFETASSPSADQEDRTTAEQIEESLRAIQDDLGETLNKQLDALLPSFLLFGYPSLPDPKLLTETTFDVARLLSNHTRIRYPGANGVHLPETYNGLGARNLIFILLKLHAFFKAYTAAQPAPGMHLIFVEEPEAHLHPQMQEVFIAQLSAIASAFAKSYSNGAPWPVQFAVSTHSSHVANRAAFRSIRYFLSHPSGPTEQFRATTVKDLGGGFANEPLKATEEFLHKYMTLTRCDLLFADKAVFVEGISERVILPEMISKLDLDSKLSSQYISIVEVGGAHAHLFFPLLVFLELQTLIITDLDSTMSNGKGQYVACTVSEGTRTSNTCIKKWFSASEIAPKDLLKKTGDEKTSGRQRIAFQIPEASGSPCGRSFEQAFILANPGTFGFDGDAAPTESASWELAREQKKSDFALEYAIRNPKWVVPLYIRDGLCWLAGDNGSVGTYAPREPSVVLAVPQG